MQRIAYLAGAAAAVALLPFQAHAAGFTLTSPDVHAGQTVAMTYVYGGCSGKNVSPALHWKDAPEGTRSFVVTLYDPDAPTGGGWWHWVVANIPASVHGLPTGAGDPNGKGMPKHALELRNDFGANAYGGPCPPKGDPPHHYQFTVYALDVDKLPVKGTTPPDQLGFMVHMHMLAKATFTALYGR